MPYTTKLIVGLTGGIGSGKTTVANLFAAHGITVIDTDKLSRDLTQQDQPAFQAIVDYFGTDVVLPTGHLNRLKLREIIFADANKRQWLEKLLHPLIREEIKRQVALAQSPYCIVVIPLLFETEPNPLINRILVVDAEEKTQISRAQSRDNLSPADIESIMKTQVNRATRLHKADDVIHNHGQLDELNSQVERLHRFYLDLA